MATRSVIKVEGFTTAQLYKHWDGYPEATLPWLEKFNQQFTEKRGDDPSYKFAQLIRSSVDPSYKFAQLIRSSVLMAEEFGLDESTETGWGVFEYNDDMGQEYEYTLRTDGTVAYKRL